MLTTTSYTQRRDGDYVRDDREAQWYHDMQKSILPLVGPKPVDEHADDAKTERRGGEPIGRISGETKTSNNSREEVINCGSSICRVKSRAHQPRLGIHYAHHEALRGSHFARLVLLLLIRLVIPSQPFVLLFGESHDSSRRIWNVASEDGC